MKSGNVKSKRISEEGDYPIRPGCIDYGKDFEFRMAALLILRCIGNKKIEDVWVAMNVDKCGAFDDVVLCIRVKNKTIIYLIQLKHQINPENIVAREFRAKDSGFRLTKYYNTICELKNETEKRKCEGVNENEILKSIKKKSDIDLKWFLYENINTNNGNAYLFDYDKLKVDEDIRNLVEKKFFLFIKQVHIDKIDIEIENAMYKVLHPLKLSKNAIMELLQKFLLFVRDWSIGELGGYYPLTKNHVLRVIFDLLTAPYRLVMEDCEIEDGMDDIDIWKEITEDKAVTIIEEDINVIEYLNKFIASEVKHYCNDPKNKNLWKRHTDKLSKDILRNVARAKKDIRFSDAYECLWKNGTVPLMLIINENNLQEIKSILNILNIIQEPLRIILLHSNSVTETLDNQTALTTMQNLSKECCEKILNQPVKLQGRPSIKLLDFINEETFNLISVKDIIYILSGKFNIGNQFTPLPDIFIERSLESVFLEPKVLEEEIEDYFIIRCILLTDFNFFTDKHGLNVDFQIFEEFESYLNCKITIFENRNRLAFEKSVQEINNESVHYLFLHPQGKLEWIKTVGDIKKIIKSRQSFDFTNFYQNVDIFNKPDVTTHILSAYPGMGKTVLIDDIAHHTPTDFWVIRINLFEYIDYYKSDEYEDADALEYLTYFNNRILDKQENNNFLNKIIFEKYLDLQKVIILLDGFDEIPVNLQKNVKEMLRILQDSGYIMYITTRPILRLQLEELLNTFAISINPFTTKDQETFLSQYFSKVTSSLCLNCTENETRVLLFVDKLLIAAKRNLNDYEQEFTGVPLQTKLLAEVFTSDFKKFLESGILDFEHFDLLYLYKNFIEQKIKIVCDRFGNSSENMLYRYKMHRSLCALQLLFSQEDLQNLNIQQLLELEIKVFPDTLQLVQKDGIVIAENQTNITFVHRSFAEYLAAEWLSENIDGEHKETVAILLKNTFNPNFEIVRNIFDRILARKCPLHLAIINRKVETIKEIIHSGNLVNKLDKGKRTFLHLIASWGLHHPQNVDKDIQSFQKAVAKDLMNRILTLVPNKYLTITRDNLLNLTPLDYAILSGSLNIANEICSRLEHTDDYISLSYNDLNYKYVTYYLKICTYPSFGSTLIKHSTVSELHNCIKKLKSGYKNKNSLQYSVIQGNVKNASMLLSTEYEINKRDEHGYALLHISSIFDRTIISQMLLVNKADLNVRDHSGKTPLHWASAVGNVNSLTLLLSYEININAVDNDGMSPLHYAIIACAKNKNTIVSELLKANADLTILDYNNKTPLHYAIHYNHIELLKILLNYGANINTSNENHLQRVLCSKDSDGGTILHWAADKGCTETIKLLLDYGADVGLEDNDGNTPLHWAVLKGHASVVTLLLNYQNDINLQNTNGMTPLHLAAFHGHEPIIDLLSSTNDFNSKKKSADIEAKTVTGNSALMMAVLNDQMSASKLLLSKNANMEAKNNMGMNPLLCALDNGYNTIAKLLLSRNADIEAKNNIGMNSLLYAVDKGNKDIIEILLSKNANVEAKDIGGSTAISYAAYNGYVDILELLLSKNASVQARDRKGYNALRHAIYTGHNNIVEILLSKNIDVNTKDERGETPLHYAAFQGNTFVSELLIAKNACVDAQDNDGGSALHLAASSGRNETVEHLLSRNANIELQNKQNRTALFNAIYFGQTETVELLLSKNADIETRDIEGNTPLLRAAYRGELDCVKLLLKKNADINVKSNDGNNVLLRAAINNHGEVIELLLSRGIDVDSQNDIGNCALQLASYNGRSDIVELLISHNANIELKDNKGNNALIYAAFNGKIDVVKLLLSRKANMESRNNEGQTPLLYAAEKGHTDVVDLLLFNGADIEAKNNYGTTPLLVAAFLGHVDTTELLLLKNADINAKNNDGNTALHRAAYNNHTNIAELLVLKGANVETKNNIKFTALHMAAYNNHRDTFGLLLSKIKDMEMKNQIKASVLRVVACNGLVDILQFLLTDGVNIGEKNEEGQSALFLAAYCGHKDVVDILISVGADVNETDNNGYTSLHVAASNGFTEIVEVLISNGANPESRSDNNETALDCAKLE
ncbi:hypothetical protein ILUMI_23894 [Ignelater luminosus]|uniref:Ankyrin repeat protein n=1 Tax=Ignelater luminosus TaxID=2038154 RepID=A0A8K0CA36_IGNLU|nr:hypothetical protein ILUMI_23894 [Ignelater luminosus]